MSETDPNFMNSAEIQAYNIRLVEAEIAAAPVVDHEKHFLFEHERQILLVMMDTRQRRGLSQADLARLVGCSRATISRIESGNVSPSLKLLLKIADVLHLGVALRSKPTRDVTV